MREAIFNLIKDYEHTIWHEYGPFEGDRWKTQLRRKLEEIGEPYTEVEIETMYRQVHEGFTWK